MPDDQKLPASLRPVGIRDTRLITRAIRQQWPIREEIRAALVARQVEIATSKEVSPGECTSAFKSLLHANQQNLALANRPKRRPPPITRETVIVPGDLQESKRRLWEYGKQLGLIAPDAVLTLSRSDSPDDA